MARFTILLIFVQFTLNYSKCESTVEKLPEINEEISKLLDNFGDHYRDDGNSTLGVMDIESAGTKFNNNSELPLSRSSRTILKNSHLKCHHSSKLQPCHHLPKFGCDPKQKPFILEILNKSRSFLKDFISNIMKVSKWWTTAYEKLKKKLPINKFNTASNGGLGMMASKISSIENKISSFFMNFPGFLDLDMNTDFNIPNPSKINIQDVLMNIKTRIHSLIGMFKSSNLLDHYSNHKINQIPDGLLDGDVNLNMNSNTNGVNLNGNGGVFSKTKFDGISNQAFQMSKVWNFLNKLSGILPIFLSIFKKLSSKSSLMACGNNMVPQQTSITFGIPGNSISGIRNQAAFGPFSSQGVLLKPLPSNINRPINMNPVTIPNDIENLCNELQHDYGLNVIRKGQRMDQWLQQHLRMSLPTVKSLSGSSNIYHGDVVILHLSQNIMLIGRVSSALNSIDFKIIHRKLSMSSCDSENFCIHQMDNSNLKYKLFQNNYLPILRNILQKLEC